MGGGLQEIGLVLFTTLAPSGIIAFVIVAIGLIAYKGDREGFALRCHRIVIPIAFALVGLIASATQLGTPANALNVFNGIGRSPLSNEVLSSIVFLALAGVFWLYSFRLDVSIAFAKVWLAVACVAGGVMLAMISQAYSFFTIPVWDSVFTPVNLVATAFVGGPPLALLTMRASSDKPNFRRTLVLCVAAIVATACCAVSMTVEHGWIGSVENGVVAATDLVPAYIPMTVGFCVLALAGIGLIASTLIPRSSRMLKHPLVMGIAGIVCIFYGIFLSRVVFYGLWMTIGL